MSEQSLKKNMLWNAFGNLVYLGCQWLITVLVYNLGDSADAAGVLSLAMSVSATFQTVAMFGIRNFQVSDMTEQYSDTCYVFFRMITCGAAFAGCLLFSLLSGYLDERLVAILLFMLFRLAENYSDVLHGIAQKNGRLDIAGKSFAMKGVGSLVVFLVGYALLDSLLLGLLLMAVFSLLSTLLYDLRATRRLSDFRLLGRDTHWLSLARRTAPLCVYLFVSSAISTLPKLILERECGTELLGVYSSIFAPALLISAAAGYIYTPFVPRFAKARHEDDSKGFLGTFLKITLAIIAFALLVLLAALLLGDFALGLLFGEKIRGFEYLLIPILIAIFAYAIFTFLCMLEVVLRDFLWLLIACVAGLLAEILLTAPWLSAIGLNAVSYSFILGSLIPTAILLFRMLWILLVKRKKGA